MFNHHNHNLPPDRPSSTEDAVTTVTDADFGDFTTGGYSVIDFYATWCGPCRQLAPIFDAAATRQSRLGFGRLDVDHNPQTAARLTILSIPTLVVFDPAGNEIDRMVGAASPRQLDTFLTDAATRAA